MIHRGWLLDPYLDGSYAHLWFKTEDGETTQVKDKIQAPHPR